MLWKWIATPIIGAVIGYVTNWVAVKMLFRPRREVYLLGRRLPFTPGVIPRGQGRLARAIGRTVETQLLTPEYLKEKLLSEEAHASFREKLEAHRVKCARSEVTVYETAAAAISPEKTEQIVEKAKQDVIAFLNEKVESMELGRRIVALVMDTAREKLAESMFGMMIGASFLEKVEDYLEERLDALLLEYTQDYIEREVQEEAEALKQKTVADGVHFLEERELLEEDLLWDLYVKFIGAKLPDLLAALHLSQIVEERINAMAVEEVEELVLSIMNKELGAIVNLGAVIGLVLGLFNTLLLLL